MEDVFSLDNAPDPPDVNERELILPVILLIAMTALEPLEDEEFETLVFVLDKIPLPPSVIVRDTIVPTCPLILSVADVLLDVMDAVGLLDNVPWFPSASVTENT